MPLPYPAVYVGVQRTDAMGKSWGWMHTTTRLLSSFLSPSFLSPLYIIKGQISNL